MSSKSRKPKSKQSLSNPNPVVEKKTCKCYVVSNLGQEDYVISYKECEFGGTLEATVKSAEVIFICAIEDSISSSSLHGTFSEAWGEDCPEKCASHL